MNKDEKTQTKAILSTDGRVLIEQPDGSFRQVESETDWERVRGMTDGEVQEAARSDPDALPLDEEFWENARVVFPSRIRKVHTGIRIDEDMLQWFKSQGKGWQTRMNAILRSYYEAHHPRP